GERCSKQLFDKAAGVLDLDAVVEHQQQHAHGHAHWHVQVSGRQNTVVVQRVAMLGGQTGLNENPAQTINGQQVQHVHHDDPQEHGQRQGRDKFPGLGIRNNGFGLVFNPIDQHFYKRLQAAWYTGCCGRGGAPQKENHNQTHQQGPEHGVVVNDTEVGQNILFFTQVVQVNQVMLDVP